MVRRRVRPAGLTRPAVIAALAGVSLAGCESQREMTESMEMADTMAVHRALEEPALRDALLDTMPGGEMAIGDSVAEMELLKDKMQDPSGP